MSEIFTNLARSTLASAITNSATSLSVQPGDGNALFPDPTGGDFFRAVLFKKTTGDVEIITVTARSADVFTIARAQEDIGNVTATAFAFDAGDIIELRPTSAFFNSLSSGASAVNIQQGAFTYAADSGAADAYIVAMSPTATGLIAGQRVNVLIGAGNTNTGGAATLTVDGLAAKSIKTWDGSDPLAGLIVAGKTYTFLYDGTDFILLSDGGVYATATVINALGRKISNIAAGSAATDAATIGGVETFINKKHTSPDINGSGTTIELPTIHDSEDDTVLDFAEIASAVNWLRIINAATGNRPVIRTIGEANTGLDFETSGANKLLELLGVASPANNLRITNAATGNTPVISVEGEDDIGLKINAKNSEEMLTLSAVVDAVNYLDIQNQSSGNAPQVRALGEDTNINLNLVSKGTGTVTANGSTVQRMALAAHTPSTAGTGISQTSIGAWVNKIIISLNGVSIGAADNLTVEVGDSGGYQATVGDYASMAREVVAGASYTDTSAFVVANVTDTGEFFTGQITLTKVGSDTNIWICTSTLYESTGALIFTSSGRCDAVSVLDRVRVTTAGGASFDGGHISFHLEG